jgi:hypothetical protein
MLSNAEERLDELTGAFFTQLREQDVRNSAAMIGVLSKRGTRQ